MRGNRDIDSDGVGSMERSLVESSAAVETWRVLGNVSGIEAGSDACVYTPSIHERRSTAMSIVTYQASDLVS